MLNLHAIDVEKIKKIRVGGYKATVEVCRYVHPRTPFEAKFSLTYTVAAKIILGQVRERAFLKSALSNPKIFALEDKIELVVDPECTAKFPLHRSAKVEIEMYDGSIYAHQQLTRHGDPDEPLSDQELVDKFYELAEAKIGVKQTQQISAELLDKSTLSVREIAKLWSLNSAL